MTERVYEGLCLACGDEWEEREPPSICPECESLAVTTVVETDGYFVDTGDHIWAETDRDGQVIGYHAASQKAVKELGA